MPFKDSKQKPLLRVTAGSSYEASSHQVVQVNSDTPIIIKSDVCSARIKVRIRNYTGLPRHAPRSSSYFEAPQHRKDQYSIQFELVPHQTVSGSALVFGNDIDHPVRDKLPYGTGAAFKILKSVIDPGLDGDLYADKPHLYGCALSSFNVLRVGDVIATDEQAILFSDSDKPASGHDTILEEGSDGTGEEWRKQREIPGKPDARKKWFLGKGRSETWSWESGRKYSGDFFNPYIDFNDFSLKLPGFSLSVLGYLGGEDYLRYVLKEKETGQVFFVVVFSLISPEEALGIEAANDSTETSHTPSKEKISSTTKTTETAAPTPIGSTNDRHEGEATFEPRENDVD